MSDPVKRQLSATGRLALPALLVSVSMTVAATPALAGNPACLWRRLPAQVRQAMVAGYAAQGLDGLEQAGVANDELADAVRTCGRRAGRSNLQHAGAALVGEALAHAAQQRLAALGIRARLDAAWRGAPSEDRRTILQAFAPTAGRTRDDDERVYVAMTKAAIRAGASGTEDPNLHIYLDYFTGRAQAEAYAPGF